jgi:predicted transcriptional regulator
MFSGLTNYCLNEVFTVMQDDFSQFHKVLGHPVRRKIIQLLGDDGGASFVKLKSFLNVSVGTIYYNLGLLEGFVSQRNDRRYVLTKKGVLLHKASRSSISSSMNSLQLYQAIKNDVLIPRNKSVPETFKSAYELLVADRGGFV